MATPHIDPRNHKPAERVAIKGLRFGERFVEFSRRHGTRVEKVLTKNYGSGIVGAMVSNAETRDWLEGGELPAA